MSKRETCGDCPHLKTSPLPMNMLVAYCGKTEDIIPHRSQLEQNKIRIQMTFWRVPLWCPLPNTEVVKRELGEKAPSQKWLTEVYKVPIDQK